MSAATSPGTGLAYGLRRVCAEPRHWVFDNLFLNRPVLRVRFNCHFRPPMKFGYPLG